MSNTTDSSNSSEVAGNTKKQPPIALWWLYTHNNYEKSDMDKISSYSSIESYIIGEEIGEEGTPHLQCLIKFKKKTRPYSYREGDLIFPELRGHWGDKFGKPVKKIQKAIDYCIKDDKYITNMPIQKKIKLLCEDKLYKYQQFILNILKEEPDDRLIYWFYEKKGNVGKSAFTKLLCSKYGAVILSGKGSDMKYGIVSYMNKGIGKIAPKIVIFDIPRESLNYLSYVGIEEVKNGCFFSSKYESEMVIYNNPHIVIFANSLPEINKVSHDRWKIYKINDDKDVDEQNITDLIEANNLIHYDDY